MSEIDGIQQQRKNRVALQLVQQQETFSGSPLKKSKQVYLAVFGLVLRAFLVPASVLEKEIVERLGVLRVVAVAGVVRDPCLVKVFLSLQPN